LSAGLARRYVLPLFEVARDRNLLDRIAGDLKQLSETLLSSEELRTFVDSPTIARTVKREVLGTLFKDASEFTLNFMRVAIDKKRSEIFILSSKLFDELVSKHRGETHGVVQSAQPLDEASFASIEKAVSSRFSTRVILKRTVDPALLGGVRVQVGNQVIDASIRGRLEKLKGILAGE
jgi:F-type H+-transporting ATPase subunit delta